MSPAPGGSRYFQALSSTTFMSPANDMGTLTKNTIDGTYQYTTKDQVERRIERLQKELDELRRQKR